jgi:nucleotide-binding universal stress UspA family protein
MYRSVVVPLDGSAASEHVLPVAIQIARGSDATLRLVYVQVPDEISTLEGGTPLDIAMPAYSTRAQAYLEHIRERLVARSDLTITADILHEPYAHASAARVAVTDTDLVVLATHHNGLAHFRLGDITDALVRWAPAPILALRTASAAPDPEPPLRFQRMLIPLDGSALVEQILIPAVALGTVMRVEYTLLYVVEPYRFVSGDPVPYTSRLDDATIAHEQVEAQDYLNGIALLMRAEGLQVQARVAVARDARTAIRQTAGSMRLMCSPWRHIGAAGWTACWWAAWPCKCCMIAKFRCSCIDRKNGAGVPDASNSRGQRIERLARGRTTNAARQWRVARLSEVVS